MYTKTSNSLRDTLYTIDMSNQTFNIFLSLKRIILFLIGILKSGLFKYYVRTYYMILRYKCTIINISMKSQTTQHNNILYLKRNFTF